MRPLRLKVQAFGPYAGAQEFDFTLLGDNTLFLVHGQTGAGKSTILDAVCFALYGECSGDERQPKQMRSDHADANLATEVELEFRLGSETYRIARIPEQVRPRKRGVGTTKSKPKATLWRRTSSDGEEDEWSVIASRWTGVTEEIERRIGFRVNQFRQVVMLPQGQFRRLLLARSSERQSILEVLFQTHLYNRIEEALKGAAKLLEERTKDARSRMELILEQADLESGDDLSEQKESLVRTLKAHEKRLDEMRAREETAQEQLADAEKGREKLHALDAAKQELLALAEQKRDFDAMRLALQEARKTMSLSADESALKSSLEESNHARENLRQAGKAHSKAQEAEKTSREEFERQAATQEQRDEAKKRLGFLEGLRERVQQRSIAQQAVIEAGKKKRKAERDLAEARQIVETFQASLADAQESLKTSEKLADNRELAEKKVKDLSTALQHKKQLALAQQKRDKASEKLEVAAKDLEKSDRELSEARSQTQRIESAWIEGQAAILAKDLVAGQPCPVCGSPEHPSPATSEADLPTEKRLKTARTKLQTLQEKRDTDADTKADTEKVFLEAKARWETRRQTLADFEALDEGEIASDLGKAQKELKEAEKAEQQVRSLTKEVEGTKEKIDVALEKEKRLKEARDQASSVLDRAKGALEEQEEGIPEEFRDRAALEDAIEGTNSTIARLQRAYEKAQETHSAATQALAGCVGTLSAAQELAEKMAEKVTALQKEFANKLLGEGFPDADAYQAAKRAPETVKKMEREIDDFHGSLTSLQDRVRRAKRETRNTEVPDFELLKKRAQEAKDALEKTLNERGNLTAKLTQVDEWLSGYARALRERDSLDKQYAIVGKISEVANGKNSAGITFQRFVLATLLDDVLSASSKRLHLMSNGRYQLRRVTERLDRRTSGGLDLEVDDAYTGATRPVATLSGGESFLASLSMALGLADVVQSYSGGIHLDTIFIDEGFGSLDPEALDLAFRALSDLRKSGRLVGIISHVPELKEWVDVRLEVTTGKKGSSARFVVG